MTARRIIMPISENGALAVLLGAARPTIEAAVTALIDRLDDLDGDADREPEPAEDHHDAEDERITREIGSDAICSRIRFPRRF